MEAHAIAENLGYISLFNAALVGIGLVVAGRILTRTSLTAGVPGERQNLGEFVLDFFVNKAREMGDGRVVRAVAPFLATCFLFILVCNLMGMLPLPLLNTPPTAYFSVTLALALCSVGGTLALSGIFKGIGGAAKHLFWPNPMQFVSEVTDVLSLSLRLFGNIGGEHMTLVLVMSVVPVGIPLILHTLGLIPAFVQALVFTLLTASFIASAIHHEEKASSRRKKRSSAEEAGGAGQVALEVPEQALGTSAQANEGV